MPFLRKFAINFAIFLAFFGVLWPVADLGFAWEPRSAAFVALSAAVAGLFFAIFDERRGPKGAARPVRRGLAFLGGFFSLLGVLAAAAVWTVGLLVWRYGEAQVLAADGTREIIGGVIGSLMLCVWYGLDRAFYPRRGDGDETASDDFD